MKELANRDGGGGEGKASLPRRSWSWGGGKTPGAPPDARENAPLPDEVASLFLLLSSLELSDTQVYAP